MILDFPSIIKVAFLKTFDKQQKSTMILLQILIIYASSKVSIWST